MELSLRTVLVILGSLFMLGILVDGFRRMRRARQEALKLDVQGNFQFPDEGFSSELPNGGARVISEHAKSELLEEAYAFKDQLDDLPGLSALEEIDTKADEEEESVYAGEPDFQTQTYAEEKPEALSVEDFDISSEPFSEVDGDNDTAEKAVLSDEAVIDQFSAGAPEQLQQEYQEFKEEAGLEAGLEKVIERAENSTRDAKAIKPTPLNLDEHVPLLMDVEELGEELSPLPAAESLADPFSLSSSQIADEGSKGNEASNNLDVTELPQDSVSPVDSQVSNAGDTAKNTDIETGQQPFIESAIASDIEPIEEEQFSAQTVTTGDENNGRQYVEDMTTQAAYAPVKKPGPNAEILADREAASLVLITHVVPHDTEGFCGEDILYLVNNCDLRHGEKDIFHRFEQPNGEGRIQFSMANSFNPGTFDPETLLHERIYGLSLFMSLPGPEKAMDAFEAMSEMASVIARNLGGDVHDETHSIMALQTIEHNRQQVRDFVRKQKIAGKK